MNTSEFTPEELVEAEKHLREPRTQPSLNDCIPIVAELDRLRAEVARLKLALESAADNGCGRTLIDGRSGCHTYWPEMPEKWCSACIARRALS